MGQRPNRRRLIALLATTCAAAGLVIAVPGTAYADALQVTNTNDSGPGSLRQAILDANVNLSTDVISFSIAGGSPATIVLDSDLPPITTSVDIDGWSQNTDSSTPPVAIRPSGTGDVGLTFGTGSSSGEVTGLSIYGFSVAIKMWLDADNEFVHNNYLGVLPDGATTSGPMQSTGIEISNTDNHYISGNLIGNVSTGISVVGSRVKDEWISDNQLGVNGANGTQFPIGVGVAVDSVGSTTLDSGVSISNNVIVGAETSGIYVTNATNVWIWENFINRVYLGGEDLVSSGSGLSIHGGATGVSAIEADYNVIVGTQFAAIDVSGSAPISGELFDNTLTGNNGAGIRNLATASTLTYWDNSIDDNSGLGIDNAPVGTDPGVAGRPLVEAADTTADTVTVSYDGPASAGGRDVVVELFQNSLCHASGFGEGASLLGSEFLTLDESGDFPSTLLSDLFALDAFDPGDIITATVTLPDTFTTEFSNCAIATGGDQTPTAWPGNATVTEGGNVDIDLVGTDPDSDSVTFSVGDPAHGFLTGPVGASCVAPAPSSCIETWTYTPYEGFSGDDSFDFTVSDESSTSAPATVDIEVLPATQADLSINSFEDIPDPVTQGGGVAYVATVENLGPNAADNATLTLGDGDFVGLPEGTPFLSGTVTSSLGGSGSCSQVGFNPVVCSLGDVSMPNDGATWTVTVVLGTGPGTPNELPVYARVDASTPDLNNDNDVVSQTTTVDPPSDTTVTEFVPPSNVTQTVATAQTITVGGESIPVAQPGDVTAAGVAVPPNGPGGVVVVEEQGCQPPFCSTLRSGGTTPPVTPTGTLINDAVVQFVPPTASFYSYRHPLKYTMTYDQSTVVGVKAKDVHVYYTDNSAPGTLHKAYPCPRKLKASTVFPCVKSVKVLWGSNPALRRDLRVLLLGTFDDPKAGTFK